ncbi:MAG: MotA/TolQ/ExbB proton channel family protein [Pseudomonadota bacterium]
MPAAFAVAQDQVEPQLETQRAEEAQQPEAIDDQAEADGSVALSAEDDPSAAESATSIEPPAEPGLEEGASLEEAPEPELVEERDWGRLAPIADLVDAGGAIIVILIVLSVLSLMVILVKLIQFAVLKVGDHRFTGQLAQLLAEGREKEALDQVSTRRGVVARVMEAAMRGKSLGADDEIIRQEVERVAKAKLDGLERGLPLLSLIATISPLLGLLGTVLGMIEAFQQLEGAGDRVDPAILSGGIWEALLTTAAGLSVAIPAAAFFTWLQRSVDVAAGHMEDAATRVFTTPIYRGSRKAAEAEA